MHISGVCMYVCMSHSMHVCVYGWMDGFIYVCDGPGSDHRLFQWSVIKGLAERERECKCERDRERDRERDHLESSRLVDKIVHILYY
jgi:hypothetical protein